nr:hypothetical protein [Sorangium cellulosum]
MDEADELAVAAAQLVRRVQAERRLGDDAERDRERDAAARLALAENEVERLAVDELHHLIEDAVLLARIDGLRDVRVVDLRDERGLVQEHRLEVGVVAQLGAQQLDGDDPRELTARSSGPHRGHAPERDGDEELIATERVASAYFSHGAHVPSNPGAGLSPPGMEPAERGLHEVGFARSARCARW